MRRVSQTRGNNASDLLVHLSLVSLPLNSVDESNWLILHPFPLYNQRVFFFFILAIENEVLPSL